MRGLAFLQSALSHHATSRLRRGPLQYADHASPFRAVEALGLYITEAWDMAAYMTPAIYKPSFGAAEPLLSASIADSLQIWRLWYTLSATFHRLGLTSHTPVNIF